MAQFPELGVYPKYYVRRVDGKDQEGGKHEGCFLFVLDLTHDPHAVSAIQTYIESCEKELPKLAADLRVRLKDAYDAHRLRAKCSATDIV